MSIDFRRPDYEQFEPDWKKVRDITEGTNLDRYLRELNPTDLSAENKKRNENYKKQAVFYGIAGYTARGMVGTVFRRDPVFDPPERLAYLKDNCDGQGNSIYQQAQAATSGVIRFGRNGLWVDFPPTEGELSQAELDQNFATIHRFRPEQIINWRTTTQGSVIKLSLVVLFMAEEEESGYEIEEVETIRELALDDEGFYYTRKWREFERNGEKVWEPITKANYPTDASGNRLTEIPFIFVGATNNDSSIDPIPILDIVRVNAGHFRNSADYEDSVWYCGQPQPWASGIDGEYYRLMNEQNFYIGSRKLMPVPPGETFGFASPDPNPMVRQAMLDKMELMIGLGARFVQPGGVARTATEAKGDEVVQHSVLSLIAANVSDAYTKALGFVNRFMGVTEDVVFALDKDFSLAEATPQEITAWVKTWLDGAIPKSDLNRYFRRVGIIDPEKSDEEIDEEMAGEEFV